MIKDVLQSINDVSIFPIAVLLLFVLLFILVVARTLLMDKKNIDEMSRLPLEDIGIPKHSTSPEKDISGEGNLYG
jgi:hypothetical protein